MFFSIKKSVEVPFSVYFVSLGKILLYPKTLVHGDVLKCVFHESRTHQEEKQPIRRRKMDPQFNHQKNSPIQIHPLELVKNLLPHPPRGSPLN